MPFKLWFPYWTILIIIILGGLLVFSDSWWNMSMGWPMSGEQEPFFIMSGSPKSMKSFGSSLSWKPKYCSLVYQKTYRWGWEKKG